MKKRSLLWLFVFLFLALCGTLALRAQTAASSILTPPRGAKLALVVFEDLQCPDCARAAPLVDEAARAYKIPVVRYDFPLPMHDWSFQGAVIAHYFDSKSPALGIAFRDYIFSIQQQVTAQNLRGFAEKFAQEHKTILPFVVDPQGKFAAEVRHERDIGLRVGIQHTPTLYVVSDNKQGAPFVEVVDRAQLFQLIDQMKAEAQ
jgi:protein-disulfide isomerase